MKFGADFEKIFFKLSLAKPKYFETIDRSFYTSDDIAILHTLASKFHAKFHETPSVDQMVVLTKSPKIKGKIDENIVELLYRVDLLQYDEEWLTQTMESWIKWRNFEGTLMDTIEYVKTTDVSPENVDNIWGKW